MSQRRGIPRRVDANHAEIVSALKSVGCDVLDLSAEGRGVPDILVHDGRGGLHFMEIKTGKGKLNRRQQEWHDNWRGPKPFVVRSVEEALRAVGKLSEAASA